MYISFLCYLIISWSLINAWLRAHSDQILSIVSVFQTISVKTILWNMLQNLEHGDNIENIVPFLAWLPEEVRSAHLSVCPTSPAEHWLNAILFHSTVKGLCYMRALHGCRRALQHSVTAAHLSYQPGHPSSLSRLQQLEETMNWNRRFQIYKINCWLTISYCTSVLAISQSVHCISFPNISWLFAVILILNKSSCLGILDAF